MPRSCLLAISGVVVAFAGWQPSLAHAGPPLLADDPHTVGPGVVQPIFAVSTFVQGADTLLLGPTADLTIGLVDSLDAIVVASLANRHNVSGDPEWTFGGLFVVGVKWEFLRRDRGSLAFSPALVLDTQDAREPAGLLPVQGELTVGGGKAAIGFDVGYIVVRSDAHEWFAALYANWAATARLKLLGEVWVLSFGSTGAADLDTVIATDVGASLGIDFGIVGNELRLLASFGTGLVSVGAPRVDLRAYIGTQHTFGARRERWRGAR